MSAIEQPKDNPNHWLLLACYAGNFKSAEAALANGAHAGTADADHFTALHAAAAGGHAALVRLLLTAGADPNSVDAFGDTPLTFAAAGGHLEVVQTLFSHPEVDVHHMSKDGLTAPQVAEANGHKAVVAYFYSHNFVGGLDLSKGVLMRGELSMVDIAAAKAAHAASDSAHGGASSSAMHRSEAVRWSKMHTGVLSKELQAMFLWTNVKESLTPSIKKVKLPDIVRVAHDPTLFNGCVFTITVVNGRKLPLLASSAKDALAWVHALRDAARESLAAYRIQAICARAVARRRVAARRRITVHSERSIRTNITGMAQMFTAWRPFKRVRMGRADKVSWARRVYVITPNNVTEYGNKRTASQAMAKLQEMRINRSGPDQDDSDEDSSPTGTRHGTTTSRSRASSARMRSRAMSRDSVWVSRTGSRRASLLASAIGGEVASKVNSMAQDSAARGRGGRARTSGAAKSAPGSAKPEGKSGGAAKFAKLLGDAAFKQQPGDPNALNGSVDAYSGVVTVSMRVHLTGQREVTPATASLSWVACERRYLQLHLSDGSRLVLRAKNTKTAIEFVHALQVRMPHLYIAAAQIARVWSGYHVRKVVAPTVRRTCNLAKASVKYGRSVDELREAVNRIQYNWQVMREWRRTSPFARIAMVAAMQKRATQKLDNERAALIERERARLQAEQQVSGTGQAAAEVEKSTVRTLRGQRRAYLPGDGWREDGMSAWMAAATQGAGQVPSQLPAGGIAQALSGAEVSQHLDQLERIMKLDLMRRCVELAAEQRWSQAKARWRARKAAAAQGEAATAYDSDGSFDDAVDDHARATADLLVTPEAVWARVGSGMLAKQFTSALGPACTSSMSSNAGSDEHDKTPLAEWATATAVPDSLERRMAEMDLHDVIGAWLRAVRELGAPTLAGKVSLARDQAAKDVLGPLPADMQAALAAPFQSRKATLDTPAGAAAAVLTGAGAAPASAVSARGTASEQSRVAESFASRLDLGRALASMGGDMPQSAVEERTERFASLRRGSMQRISMKPVGNRGRSSAAGQDGVFGTFRRNKMASRASVAARSSGDEFRLPGISASAARSTGSPSARQWNAASAGRTSVVGALVGGAILSQWKKDVAFNGASSGEESDSRSADSMSDSDETPSVASGTDSSVAGSPALAPRRAGAGPARRFSRGVAAVRARLSVHAGSGKWSRASVASRSSTGSPSAATTPAAGWSTVQFSDEDSSGSEVSDSECSSARQDDSAFSDTGSSDE